jgi:hypothetical protein
MSATRKATVYLTLRAEVEAGRRFIEAIQRGNLPRPRSAEHDEPERPGSGT